MSELLTRVEQLCEVPPGTLNSSSVIEEIPGWSSLQFLGLLAAVDEIYGVTLKPRQLLDCITLGDLHSLMLRLKLAK